MIRYKIDVLAALRAAGYSQNRIRNEKLLGVSVMSKIRAGGLPSWHEMAVICQLLQCQPGDIVEYVEDTPAEG
jgi:putative transcriptional regulator